MCGCNGVLARGWVVGRVVKGGEKGCRREEREGASYR